MGKDTREMLAMQRGEEKPPLQCLLNQPALSEHIQEVVLCPPIHFGLANKHRPQCAQTQSQEKAGSSVFTGWWWRGARPCFVSLQL